MRRNTVADIQSKLDKCVPTNGPLDTPCLIWPFAKNSNGYGSVSVGGIVQNAHRVAWTIRFGNPNADLLCCHKCDNRACCNTDHLFLGTNADNNKDMMDKGRHVAPRGDRNGSRKHPERRPRGKKNGTHTCPESVHRGEKHYAAKLTDKDVVDIRRKYEEGSTSHRKLASEYKVSHILIGKIVRKENWKHVNELSKLAWEQEAA